MALTQFKLRPSTRSALEGLFFCLRPGQNLYRHLPGFACLLCNRLRSAFSAVHRHPPQGFPQKLGKGRSRLQAATVSKAAAGTFAIRLVHFGSPHAPPALWEWVQPYIDHLVLSARSFQTARVVQRYFRDEAELDLENHRIWEAYYRPSPLFDHLPSWPDWLAQYRQIVTEVQALSDIKPSEMG